VALKVVHLGVLPQDRRTAEQRFLREARLAARLSHPNVVIVYDVGWELESGTPFIALEYLEGRTLAEVMGSGASMGWRAALQMTARVADALHHAHTHGIVHRDIKPSNIMVLHSGAPKIMDFGIAKTGAAAQLTITGEFWGTPSYMSPEQALGATLDGRTDLFSLGTVLYQLLTGRRAFDGHSVPQVVTRVVYEEPTLPAGTNPALPADVDVVLTRALAKNPALRYPNGHAFAEDIADVLAGRGVRERPGLKTLSGTDATVAYRPAGSPSVTCPVSPAPPRRRLPPFDRILAGTLSAAACALWICGLLRANAASIPASVAAAALQRPRLILPKAVEVPPQPVPPPATPSAAEASLAAPPPRSQPRPTPVPEVAEAPAPAPEPARIALSLEHRFKQGTLRVWIDEKLVLERELQGRQTRKILIFKSRKGSLAEVLDVAPGTRQLRLEVEGEGGTRSGRVEAVLKSRETRLLEVKVGGKVDLAWKS